MDGLSELKKLMAAVNKKAEELNLDVLYFAALPSPKDGDRDVLNITFRLTPEAVESAEATMQRSIDSQFEDLFKTEFGDVTEFADDETVKRVEKEKKKREDARDDIQRLLDDFDQE